MKRMAQYEEMKCKNCKYYEAFHKYPNPNAVATHYCTKCKEEIEYRRSSPLSDWYLVWLPKKCYFNGYFEESEEAKKKREERYGGITFCQVE